MLTNFRASVVASSLLLSIVSAQASATGIQTRFDKEACAMPEYTAESLSEEQEGAVTVKLLVQPDGSVADAKVVESSGFLTLDKASRRAGARCKFKPVAKGSDIAQGWVTVRYSWIIN